MNERLPYEDELVNRLNDLPLPNEEMAWEDMRRRLEKDDGDKPVIVPLLKGCGGYAILLISLAIVLLLIIDPAKWFHTKVEEQPNNITVVETKTNDNKDRQGGVGKTVLPGSTTKNNVNTDSLLSVNDSLKSRFSADDSSEINNSAKIKRTTYQRTGTAKNVKRGDGIRSKKHQPVPVLLLSKGQVKVPISDAAPETAQDDLSNSKEIEHPQKVANNDSSLSKQSKDETGKDSIKHKAVDTIVPRQVPKQDSLQGKPLYFGAGLGMHQLLPIAGQKSNPYNSLGRKSSLGDYIPSVYLRLYKDKKWFIQSEFRYGAPQYTKEIIFNQKKFDSIGSGIPPTITNSTIKKTFYHQLPLSFNYFVVPGLSIGTGISFNRFQSALVQEDVYRGTTQSPDSLVSTELKTQEKADSNFVTTYIQALIEAQYKWKRISVGARYSFGLQPYLKFTLPGGEEGREKNSSLQLFIRYEFWRSGKKK